MAKENAKKESGTARGDAEAFVEAVLSGKNIKASARLEKMLRAKTERRIAEVLGD